MIKQSQINNACNYFTDRLDKKLLVGAEILLSEIKSDCPVDTGNMKSLLTRKKMDICYYRILSGADYTDEVVFGTKRRGPNDFMTRGITNATPKIKSIL